jgi:hypothetical protein
MHTQKISMMKLIEAELQQRVEQSERELSKIETIVRLSEVRTTIEDLQVERRKAATPVPVQLPPGEQAS